MKEQDKQTFNFTYQKINQHILGLNQMKCLEGNQAVLACFSKYCAKYPFQCVNEQCTCYKQHDKCFRFYLKDLIKSFNNKIVDLTPYIQGNNKMADNLIDKIIDQISKLKEKNQQLIRHYFFQQIFNTPQKEVLDKVYNKKINQLNGETFFKVCAQTYDFQLNVQKQREQCFKKIMQNWKSFEYLLEKSIKINEQIKLDSFDMQLKIKNKYLANLPESNVVKTQEQLLIIHGFFQKKIKKFQLLYKASQNNFKVQNFYKNCVKIPNTIVLIQTQFGRKIGGFTPLCWKNIQNGNTINQADLSKSSFLFSLTNNEKFIQLDQKCGIRNQSNYGPIFENEGCSQLVIDQCNKKSYFRIIEAYKHPNYKQQSKSILERLSGNPNNQIYFKAKQWQVWRIIFE